MDHIRVAASLLVLLSLAIGCAGDDGGRRATATPTATTAASAVSAVTSTATRIVSATATRSVTATAIETVHETPIPTVTATASHAVTETATRTLEATATITVTALPTATAAPSESTTPTGTPCTCVTPPTPTSVPSPSPAGRPPQVTYVGVALVDDLPQQPSGVDASGRPVFVRPQGQGMRLVVEARRGDRPLEMTAYEPDGPRRGVEILVSRPLGDGSPAVCDAQAPLFGGVPGIDPPIFSDAPAVDDAIDDLVCRVSDVTGAPRGRVMTNACTLIDPTAEYGFVESESELQFCLPIVKAWGFPLGDTIVAARVRDVAGLASPPREIVVRVQGIEPFSCDDEQSLGERVFTVARPGSTLVTSLSGGDDVSRDPWLGSLDICAGPDLSGGVHPLELRADAVLRLGVSDGRTLCVRLTASGSSGILDCDGGTAADVVTQIAGSDSRVTVDTGLGVDAGTGAAVLRVPLAVALLPAGVPPGTCEVATQSSSTFTAALTTATGIAQILDVDGAVLAEVQASGVNFDCSAWRAPGAAKLVLPFPTLPTGSGNVAAALLLAE